MEYFDRVVVINLKRRIDRKERLLAHFSEIQWPFREPEWFEAVDSSLIPEPMFWTAGAGAWGCMQSHRQVLERAMMDGVNSLLVLEDDVFFVPGFAKKALSFMQNVPGDWEQIMFGGQFVDRDMKWTREAVADGVDRVAGVERTHAYAVRGRFMRDLYSKWCASTGHCDHVMGPFQHGRAVYAPSEFLAGQAEGKSDISHNDNPAKLWVKPPGDWAVTLFVGTPEAAREFRIENGKHSGHNLTDEVDIGLKMIMGAPEGERVEKLRSWVSMIEWEGKSKTPEKQCMIYGVPEALCRAALGDRLVVAGAKRAGCCGGARNAVSAAMRVATAVIEGNEVLVSPEDSRRRHSICKGCEHFIRSTMISPHTCALCSCVVSLKVRLATEKCPAGKWT